MTTLSPESDQSVRQAVDAYLVDGAFRPEVGHEARFETRNGHYRLVGGVLLQVVRGAVNDVAHVGSELVGWLWEGQSGSRVELSWRHGARGVLVDRRHGRHIVITSTTRNFVSEMPAASALLQAGSMENHHGGSVEVLPTAGTIPFAGHTPEAAGGVPRDTSWSAPPARWGALSPTTLSEPIRAPSPAAIASGVSGHAEAPWSPATTPSSASAAGGARQAVPATPPPPRPLPLPVAPPRRLDTHAPEAAAAIHEHRSPVQLIVAQTREAARANQPPVARDRSAPLVFPQTGSGIGPGRGPASLGMRLDDAEEDAPSTVPIAAKPLLPLRPTSAHVQRGMLLR